MLLSVKMSKKGESYIIRHAQEKIAFRLILRPRKTIEPMIQIEIERTPGNWKEVIRWDCSHGYPHRDLFFADGKRKKEPTNDKTLEGIIVEAIEDLKKNLRTNLVLLGYGQIAGTLPPPVELEKELEKIKKELLGLAKNPERIAEGVRHWAVTIEATARIKDEVHPAIR